MLTKKQIEFCEAIAEGKNATQAYFAAFKNPNRDSCRAEGNRLIKLPAIADKIAEMQALNKKIVEEMQRQSIGTAVLRQIVSSAKRMELLSQIALGQQSLKRVVTSDDKTVVIETWPSFTQRIAAIMALNQMDGSTEINPGEHEGNEVQTLDF